MAQWQSFTEWWQAPLLVLVALAVAAFVIVLYRRDSVELRPGIGALLAVLRLTAFAGLLLAYLDLQKWSEQREVEKSRVLVLADTSLSMRFADADAAGGTPVTTSADSVNGVDSRTRIGQVISEFTGGQLLPDLRKTHDVSVWRFDEHLNRVAMLPKLSDTAANGQTDVEARAAAETQIRWLRYLLDTGLVLLALSAVGMIVRRAAGGRWGGWLSALGITFGLLLSFGAAAALSLSHPNDDLLVLAGWRESPPPDAAQPAPVPSPAADQTGEHKVDWATALNANGTETRLGECLRQLINDQRAQPISGVILLTDGGQNAGLDPAAAVEAAREAKIPVYAIGLGSDRRPASVRIANFAAPPRVYPGDSFTVTADLEAARARRLAGGRGTGLAPGRQAARRGRQELEHRGAASRHAPDRRPQGAGEIRAAGAQGAGPADAATASQAALRRFRRGKLFHANEVRPRCRRRDPRQRAGPEIPLPKHPKIKFKKRTWKSSTAKTACCLLPAGRRAEYQFLRNMLRRDKDTVVDVLLQTATPGVSQDAHEILDHFPDTKQEISQYDAIVAFDPDWQHLDADPTTNADCVKLLEWWVAEESGGLVLIPGPIYTNEWVKDRQLNPLLALYPVEFDRLLAEVSDAKFGGENAGAIEFTREGQAAEFLWLGMSAAASKHAWDDFKGVYGYFRVKGKKPGATVYARFADPDLGGTGDALPIYMAGQLYGAGRVFYLGSGEIWRLRALDEAYFEQFYTKLLRYVSQGRMLRGSRRGTLSVDLDSYLLGSTVNVEARLTDPQHQPLALAKVVAEVTPQDGGSVHADAGRRPKSQGLLPRPIRRFAAGKLSDRVADSRLAGRAADPADHGQGARSGKRQSAAERRPAVGNHQAHRRPLLRRSPRGARNERGATVGRAAKR